MEMNRRSFLQGAATTGILAVAGVAGIGCESQPKESQGGTVSSIEETGSGLTADIMTDTWSFEVPPEPILDSDITETLTADIIVVGGGMSGMCTACSASEKGADVIVITASSKAISRGGSNNGINTQYQHDHGITYTEQDAMKTIKIEQSISTYSIDTKKWMKWINNSAESVDWMCDVMAKQGLQTSLEFGYVDPDDITTCQASSHNFWNDEQPFGALFGAPLQAQAYARAIEEQGGRIYYDTVAEQLIRENNNSGRVSAVIAKDRNGAYLKFQANTAVVLATGDFSKDRDMMARYSPHAYELFKDKITWDQINYDDELVYTGLYPGWGHKMGLWVGAAWQHSYPNAPMMYLNNSWPSMGGIASFQGINMDVDGKRFMNENSTMVFMANVIEQRPSKKIFFIWDSDYAYLKDHWDYFGTCLDYVNGNQPYTPEELLATWDEKVDTGTWMKADTVEELLGQFEGFDAETGFNTVQDWNTYCDQGYDPEFQDNPAILHPVRKAPFYGSFVDETSLAFLTVVGGLRTNENMQVCDEDDNPLEGLYCTGTMTGDFYANQYTFTVFGQNLGALCCTLSYVLGRDLAAL